MENDKIHYLVVDISIQNLISYSFCFYLGDRVQFEKDCNHIQSTLNDFLSWINSTDNHTLSADHPLHEYSNQEYFAYADYMHLPELFENESHPLINV